MAKLSYLLSKIDWYAINGLYKKVIQNTKFCSGNIFFIFSFYGHIEPLSPSSSDGRMVGGM